MNEITTVGLDLAKRVVSVCGEDAAGRVVVQRSLRREAVLDWSSQRPPCVIGNGSLCQRPLVRPRADGARAYGADHGAGVRATVPVVGEE